MAGQVEQRLTKLGIELPQAEAPAGNYVPTVFAGLFRSAITVDELRHVLM